MRLSHSPVRTLARALARVIAPPTCVLCGAAGQDFGELWGLDLCPHCQAACPRAAPEPPPLEHAFCLFRYEDPVDRMIVRLKFQHDLAMARVLGTLLAHARRASNLPLPECIVPLPLHHSRYRERGFCQTTEIAHHVARRLRAPGGAALPVRPDLLQRVRATRAQSGLSATERARNLAGAFACRPGARPPSHVALLDDVLTTGHTSQAAFEVLRDAGARHVELWFCARALRRDNPQDEPQRPADPAAAPT